MNELNCTVIYFDVAGKRKYVAELPIRPDNRIVPIFSDSLAMAHLFENEADARQKIDRFVNHNNHDYKTMPHKVKLSKRNAYKLEGGDLL